METEQTNVRMWALALVAARPHIYHDAEQLIAEAAKVAKWAEQGARPQEVVVTLTRDQIAMVKQHGCSTFTVAAS